MGLDCNGISLILYAKRLGVSFQNTVTIGRQGLHLSPSQVKYLLSSFGIEYPMNTNFEDFSYCEKFITLLGADSVESIDYSRYEDATIIHDMNHVIPKFHKSKYSAVIDAGTLEHVFNFPIAIKNCMELVKPGGHFVGIVPANNFMGHGFYQFSPELYFSTFTEDNGFEILKMIVCEDYEGAQWYEVSKPNGGIHGRVTLTNHKPTYLMCIARRLDGAIEPFMTMPQQSDYIEAWEKPAPSPKIHSTEIRSFDLGGLVKGTFKTIPGVKSLARNLRYLLRPKFNARDFTPINPLKKHYPYD